MERGDRRSLLDYLYNVDEEDVDVLVGARATGREDQKDL